MFLSCKFASTILSFCLFCLDFPVCMSVEDHNNICAKRGMVLISPRFLGMASPSTVYIYTVENIPAVVLMKVKVIDFEISCNAGRFYRKCYNYELLTISGHLRRTSDLPQARRLYIRANTVFLDRIGIHI